MRTNIGVQNDKTVITYKIKQHITFMCLPIYQVIFAIKFCKTTFPSRSQYPEGPATGHLDTGFFWFPCVYKRMLRWFTRLQVATTCLSCSHSDLNFLVTYIDGFGGLVVSILATGTRVRLFKPGRSRWIFRASGKSSVCLPSEGK